jgi:hypothetical protein
MQEWKVVPHHSEGMIGLQDQTDYSCEVDKPLCFGAHKMEQTKPSLRIFCLKILESGRESTLSGTSGIPTAAQILHLTQLLD